ncbi:MAG: phage portal protein [Pseudomonadota bacterium]
MNQFLNWLKPSFGQTLNYEQKNQHGNLVALHMGDGPVWSLLEDGGIAKNGYCRNPVVYRCVSMISEAASSIPLVACEDRVDCDEHPILDLVQKPNAHQSGVLLLQSLYAHLLISGNAYLNRVSVDGVPKELYSLDPSRMAPIKDDRGWPEAYNYSTVSGQVRYSTTGVAPEVLRLSMFNPLDDTNGLSPLRSAHMALDIHNAASSWNKALLDNSARPSGALVYAAATGENLSEDQFNRLKSELEEGYTGATRAGRPMVLEGGLDWKAMAFSPRDMDFLEAKNGAAREIALAFGIPPMVLGIPGDNTYSNYQEANRAFWRQTIIPLVEKITQQIGNWLTADFEGTAQLRPNYDTVHALNEEREKLWSRIGAAEFLTSDEKREVLGFAPLEGEGNV